MKYYDLFKQIVGEDYSEEVALTVIQIMTIHLSKKITLSHIENKGEFSNEIIEDAKSLLFQTPEEVVKEALQIWSVMYDYEISQSLHGLGGCKKKTFRQLVQEAKEECL